MQKQLFFAYISALKAEFKRFFTKIHEKMNWKVWKAPKDTPGAALNRLCHWYTPLTIIENVKAKWRILKDFLENRPFWAKSLTKIVQRSWAENASKRQKKARNRPRSVKKRFFEPNLHLDTIWKRLGSHKLQKMKKLCPPHIRTFWTPPLYMSSDDVQGI